MTHGRGFNGNWRWVAGVVATLLLTFLVGAVSYGSGVISRNHDGVFRNATGIAVIQSQLEGIQKALDKLLKQKGD